MRKNLNGKSDALSTILLFSFRALAAPNGTPRITKKRQVKILRKVRPIAFDIDLIGPKKQNESGDKKTEVEPLIIGRLKQSPFWIFRHGNSIK